MKYTKQELAAKMRQYRASETGKKIVSRISARCRRTAHGRFMEARSHAKKRGLSWELSEAQHIFLVSNAVCHYCSGVLPETSAGLDRKDNLKGYSIDNVVPCCYTCNTMKGRFLTYDEMILVWNKRRGS